MTYPLATAGRHALPHACEPPAAALRGLPVDRSRPLPR